MHAFVTATAASDIEDVIYQAARILLYPVLIAAIVCLVWVVVELGWFVYEVYLRVRYRDLEALEIRTLKARDAFENGQPRRAYRYLQENNYSLVVAKFLFELIRNYQTQRLPEKPLKLLQEYEFYTVKRLEKTRILVRVGPMLGLMGTLIPLTPALTGLAAGNTEQLATNLRVAFSVTVLGLLIGGIAFIISIVRDRIYSQDLSDLEYMLELLEGGGGQLRIGKPRQRRSSEPEAAADLSDEEETQVLPGVMGAEPAAPPATAVMTAPPPVVVGFESSAAAPAEPGARPEPLPLGSDWTGPAYDPDRPAPPGDG